MPPRVLIIDDDADTARMLSMLLATTGARTQAVTDPHQALDAFAELQPQMVVLDLSMPGMDGFDLCRRIRAFPAAEGVLITILSGWTQPEYKERAIEAGANYYFVKPADPVRLLELVRLLSHERTNDHPHR